MKQKKLIKKLTLKKETISNISDLSSIKGGYLTTLISCTPSCYACNTEDYTCDSKPRCCG